MDSMEELEQLSTDVQEDARANLPELKSLKAYIQLDNQEKTAKDEKQKFKAKAIEEAEFLKRSGIKEYEGAKISYTPAKYEIILNENAELEKLKAKKEKLEGLLKEVKEEISATETLMIERGQFTTDEKKKTKPRISLSYK